MSILKTKRKEVLIVDQYLGDVQISSGAGYNSLSVPSAPSGYVLLCASAYSASFSGNDYPTVQGNGQYIYGTKGKTYSHVVVRFIYVHT